MIMNKIVCKLLVVVANFLSWYAFTNHVPCRLGCRLYKIADTIYTEIEYAKENVF